MSALRFDKRVAVITGSGRGLGRAYAELLASLGAKVVINDVGGSLKGEGADIGPAQEVVNAIKAAGGTAVANTDSVATVEGGKAIIQSALDHFGRIDILIHNAGNVRRAPLREMSYDDFNAVLDVHLRGAFHVVREAFPRMCDQNYGRIVLTSSVSGLYGNKQVVNYATSKTGMIGLCNVAGLEGAEHNVKCNIIAPGAVTRMAEGLDTSVYPPMGPELVAPLVAWMAHEQCSVSGEILSAMAGRLSRLYLAETPGVYRPSWTVDEVDAHIAAIRDTSKDPWILPPVPTGQPDHIRRSFEMARKGGA
jgi:NAD(P)-dependent dehydrogenase (short-subunit alcohol dehydrogenase family)